MAGDWIKMRTNLGTDPAVVRMASGLRTDVYAIVGRLHRVWSWANEHLTDGQNVPVDSAFLDKLTELSGFAEAMRSVGWLSGRDGDLCFPSFERHNGASAKARALDAERKRNARKTSEDCPVENRTRAGPEKRRVEKRRTNTLSHSREELPKETHLTDARFAAAWDRWGRHLLEHNKPLTTTAQESQLYKLADFSVDEAIAIVEFSILKDSKSLILNGDHRPREDDSRGVVTGRRRNLTSEDIRI